MMASTPRSASQRMRSGSSQVQVLTARPASWATRDEVLVDERRGAGGRRTWPRSAARVDRAPSRVLDEPEQPGGGQARAPARAPGRRWAGGSTRRGRARRRARRACRRAASTTPSATRSAGSKSLVVGPVLDLDVHDASGRAGVEGGGEVGHRRRAGRRPAVSTTARPSGSVASWWTASAPSAVRRTSSSTPSAP